MIPYRLFYTLLGAIGNVAGAEQLQAYYAALLATAQVHGSKESASAIRDAVAALTALAYPNVSPAAEAE